MLGHSGVSKIDSYFTSPAGPTSPTASQGPPLEGSQALCSLKFIFLYIYISLATRHSLLLVNK